MRAELARGNAAEEQDDCDQQIVALIASGSTTSMLRREN
jgi:hypothetical protein